MKPCNLIIDELNIENVQCIAHNVVNFWKYPLFIATIAAIVSSVGFADSDVPSWKFVSIPDFLNNDVGYPEANWDGAVDYVLENIKKENPDFVVVAGDLVMGRWYQDSDHIKEMSAIYYSAWKRRFQKYDLTYYCALGDHEIGDNPWCSGGLIPIFKKAFRDYLQMPLNGPQSLKGSAFYIIHKNMLLVVVDCFEQQNEGDIRVDVSGEQLKWVKDTFDKFAAGRHVVVVGHVPVLPKWRARSSSQMSLMNAEESEFWQLMERFNVDLYLCGEVHDISIQQKNKVTQIVHGTQPSSVNEINYLLVTVFPNKLELELKQIGTFLEGKIGLDYDPFHTDEYRQRTVSILPEVKDKGFISVGKMIINKKGTFKNFEDLDGFFVTRMDIIKEAAVKP